MEIYALFVVSVTGETFENLTFYKIIAFLAVDSLESISGTFL